MAKDESKKVDDAKQAAQERMKAALEAKERGEDIIVDQSSLESQVDTKKTDSKQSKGTKSLKDKKLENVKVYSPFQVYFDGDAKSVSAENLTGPFDILYGHKNFMSLLVPCDVIVRSDRGEEIIKIDRGVMHVRNNLVNIFLDV